jgi:hypothetical protein
MNLEGTFYIVGRGRLGIEEEDPADRRMQQNTHGAERTTTGHPSPYSIPPIRESLLNRIASFEQIFQFQSCSKISPNIPPLSRTFAP